MMYVARSLQSLPCLGAQNAIKKAAACRRGYTSTTSATTIQQTMEIPKRIPRSPTDILRALASTVERDPTAPHYKYHDDPYLIPASNVTKRTFSISQEAGRKAAQWIKQEHSSLFLHKEAQPPVIEFAPNMVYTEQSQVSEADLNQLIATSQVNDAILVYNLLQQHNGNVSNELKQSLLELLAFYNHEEPLPEEFIEERWYKDNTAARDRIAKAWKDGELAEKLFVEIEPKNAATYAALIRGMAKYNQAERALTMFQEANEKQIAIDTETFNSIIRVIPRIKESADERWSFGQELLLQMAQQHLLPNLGTLNSMLENISSFPNNKLARISCLKTLSEFKKLGIAPSLGSFFFVLRVFCRDRAPVSHVLMDILRECEGKAFRIQHECDIRFFTYAMDICRNHLQDKVLAKMLHKLLHTANNYDLVGDTYRESLYYRHFLVLLCQTESLEEFMQTYDLLVPHIYTPEPGIMEEILKAVDMQGGGEHIPRLWSDTMIFDYWSRENILTLTLNIMLSQKPIQSQSQLNAQFAKVATDIFSNIVEAQTTRRNKVTLTGNMIGSIMTLLARVDTEFSQLIEVFLYADKNQDQIVGTPHEESLRNFIEACIRQKAPTQAIQGLQYAVENNMDSLPLAQLINSGFTLNEVHLLKIKSLVGLDFL